MVNNMITNNNIKQLKRKLSLISLGNTLIANKQFKQYQNEQSSQSMSTNSKTNTKDQYMVELQNVESVSADKVIVLADGKEYLQSLADKKELSKIKAKLDAKPCVEFDTEGHTKQDLIDIYIAFDNIMKSNKKHPKPEDFEVTHKPKVEDSEDINHAKP
jgi:hypothetical protein